MSYHFSGVMDVWQDAMKEAQARAKEQSDKDQAATIRKFSKDIAKELPNDWNGVIEKAAIQAHISLPELQKAFPLPKVADLDVAAQGVELAATMLRDGKLDPAEMKQIGHVLADAASKALAPALATLGMAAGPIGSVVGVGLGKLAESFIEFFSGEREERYRAQQREARESMDAIRDRALAYEKGLRSDAWKQIAVVSGSGDLVIASDYGERALSSNENKLIEKYKKRTKELLKKFGFAPSSGELEWNAILRRAWAARDQYYLDHACDLDYDKPSRGKAESPPGFPQCDPKKKLEYHGTREDLSPHALKAMVESFSKDTTKRVSQDASAMAILAAYVAQLRGMRDTAAKAAVAVKAVTAAMKDLARMYPQQKKKSVQLPVIPPPKKKPVSLPQIVSHAAVVRAKRAATKAAEAKAARKRAEATRKAADIAAAHTAEKAAAAAMREATKVEAGAEIPWGMVALGVGVVGLGAYAWRRSRAA